MSELVWNIKNGELDSVKNEIENKVLSYNAIKFLGKHLLFVQWQGIDVNLDVDGRPLILYAADFGQHTIVNYLISKGADPNVRS